MLKDVFTNGNLWLLFYKPPGSYGNKDMHFEEVMIIGSILKRGRYILMCIFIRWNLWLEYFKAAYWKVQKKIFTF